MENIYRTSIEICSRLICGLLFSFDRELHAVTQVRLKVMSVSRLSEIITGSGAEPIHLPGGGRSHAICPQHSTLIYCNNPSALMKTATELVNVFTRTINRYSAQQFRLSS